MIFNKPPVSRLEAHPKTVIAMVLAALIALLVAGAEFLTRIVATQFIPKDYREIYQDHDRYGWTYRPGFQISLPNPLGAEQIALSFNKDGFRERELDQLPPGDRVMFIGDSGTGSIQVRKEERFSDLVEEQSRGRLVSVNFGVNGFGTDQAVMVAETYLPLIKPKYVVYFFSDNDLQDNMSREVEIWPYKYGKPTYNSNMHYVAKPYSQRAIAGNVVYYYMITYLKDHSALFAAVTNGLKRLFTKKSADQAALNSTDAMLVQRIPLDSQLSGPVQLSRWAKLEQIVLHLDQVAKSQGAHLLIVPFLNYIQVNNDIMEVLERHYSAENVHLDFNGNLNGLASICQRNHLDCPAIDVEEARRYQLANGQLHFVKGKVIYDGHMTPVGHRLIASKITRALATATGK